MDNITLELNKNEAEVLIQLLDIATKAQGLNAAEAALTFVKKISEQMPQQKPSEETPSED
jgi:hypothetical protein|tara:strand:- start:173 stop:352 length:180 start_codon:yes stop_codon:yes gene_type:complete